MRPADRVPDVRQAKAFRDLSQAVEFERNGMLAEADAAYGKVIKKNPDYFDALHFYGLFKFKRGQFAEAVRLIEKAQKLNPRSLNALNSLGVVYAHAKNFDKALNAFDKIIERDRNNIHALSNKAQCLNELGRFQEAIGICNSVVALDGTKFDAYIVRGAAQFKLSVYEHALSDYQKAVQLNPRSDMAWCGIGNCLHELKNYDRAISSYDNALSLNSNLAQAWVGRGNVSHDLKLYEDAFAAYDRALSIAPESDSAWVGRANVLHGLRRYAEAMATYDKAVSIRPDLDTAWLGRGNVLSAIKRYDEAIVAYQRALSIKPDLAQAWVGLGSVFHELRRHEESLAAFDRGLKIKPDLPFLEGDRLHLKMSCCVWSDLDVESRAIMNSVRAGKAVINPFFLLSMDASPEDLLRCANTLVQHDVPVRARKADGAVPKFRDKIRVGYLSADFRTHPVAYLAAGLFENHDRARFETYAFSVGTADASEIRSRLENSFNHFIDLNSESDAKVVETIRGSQVDILVDLNGHTSGARLRVLAQRPAPILVNYLGFAGTIGSDLWDYIIADKTVMPEENQKYFSEKVLYLPHCFMPHDEKGRVISDRPLNRQDHGLPEKAFVFCCFNNTYKFNPDVFQSWMNILRSVDGSVLWLSDSQPLTQRNLMQEAERLGVEPMRLVFAKRLDSSADHLARHRLADLFLDTRPYNAHTTASDALWAGLPVLTHIGQTFAARVAASLLSAIGLPELITRSREEYESMAVTLAANRDMLLKIRETLNKNRLTTPLFDTRLFVKHIEAGFEAIYRRHEAGLPPDHIEIQPIRSVE